MVKHFFQESAGEMHFLGDLFHTLNMTLRQRHKRLSQLRFARPTVNGWSFFSSNVSWDILDDITQRVVKLHEKCCRKEKIIDALSELVNLPEKEFTHIRLVSS